MLSSRTNSFYQFQKCGHSLKRASLEHLTQGLKLTFCHTCQWPVMWSNLPAKIFFYQTMKHFVQKQAVVTTTMTKHIYNVFNFSFTYKKTTTKRFIDIYFLFVPKKRWDSCSLHVFLANGAGHCVMPVSHILGLQCLCGAYIFCTHGNGLEQGYSISFIWGLDYRIENLLSYWTLYGHLRLFN